jgi:N-ethylmaleimide reductase
MPNHVRNALLTPYQLGDLNLRNRIVMAPLTRTRAENPGHVPNDLMVVYYAQRASAGLIITEGTWVSEEAQGWYGVPGIYNEEQGQAWRKVTDTVHARGGRIFVQLWHQGGVSHHSFYPDGRQPVAPSAINLEQHVHIRGGRVMSDIPRAMSSEDIKRTVSDFKSASRIALEAGFDGIQLQAGYVYLFNQFLHESTNQRTDEYGGPIENRSRFFFEVLDAVLEVWPSQRVGVKHGPMMNELGAFKAVGSTLAVSEYVYEKLSSYNLSHALLMRQLTDLTGTPIEALSGDAVIHHFRKRFKGSLIANAGIDAEHGAQLVSEGAADLVTFGRDYIANPDLVERIAIGAALNSGRPEYYYGSSAVGYIDYPFLGQETSSHVSAEAQALVEPQTT